jgi:hypothetical protein
MEILLIIIVTIICGCLFLKFKDYHRNRPETNEDEKSADFNVETITGEKGFSAKDKFVGWYGRIPTTKEKQDLRSDKIRRHFEVKQRIEKDREHEQFLRTKEGQAWQKQREESTRVRNLKKWEQESRTYSRPATNGNQSGDDILDPCNPLNPMSPFSIWNNDSSSDNDYSPSDSGSSYDGGGSSDSGGSDD